MIGRFINRARDFWRRKGPKSLAERLIVYGAFVFFPAVFLLNILLFPEPATNSESEPPDIVYENSAGTFVRVFVNGYYQASLEPGESKEDRYFYCRHGCLLEAADRGGRVIFTRWLTRTSVEVLKKHVVIQAED